MKESKGLNDIEVSSLTFPSISKSNTPSLPYHFSSLGNSKCLLIRSENFISLFPIRASTACEVNHNTRTIVFKI